MKKIIILGAGQVGTSVAESLILEKNDVTVIDKDAVRLNALQSRLDLRTVVGNAGHPSVLIDAGIEDCELLIAVTEVDEINMMACKIAHGIFNVPTRIARIRSNEYLKDKRLSDVDMFSINHVICPEQILTDYVLKLVQFPEALQVLEFANGLVSLVAIRAHNEGLLVGSPISDIHKHMPDIDARIVAIFRDNQSIRPDGNKVIRADDEIFFLSETRNMRQVMEELRKMDRPVNRVMIAGGSEISFRLAQILEDKHKVKLLESDHARSKFLSANLKSTLVLKGAENDMKLLAEENIEEIDLYVSATGNDEKNIIGSLIAKKMGARRVVTLIHESAYVPLLEDADIDIVIGLSDATIGSILSHVRRADVIRDHSLRRGAAEALEIVIHGDKSTSACVGKRVDEINWPDGAMLGAIVRKDKVLMAHHAEVLQDEDHIIVFVSNKNDISKIEKLIQVSGLYI